MVNLFLSAQGVIFCVFVEFLSFFPDIAAIFICFPTLYKGFLTGFFIATADDLDAGEWTYAIVHTYHTLCIVWHLGQSVLYCTQCHAQAPVPEGWLSMGEYNEMMDVD